MLKVGSLFAGMGGFCLAFAEEGFEVAWANEPGFHAGVIESQAGMELARLESEYWPTGFIMWRSPS